MTPVLTLHTTSAEQTMRIGEMLASFVAPGDVVLLSGDLGAGKTQLTKGLAIGLGVEEPVTSPTFNILLVHEGRIPLYHLDLYRLEHASELEDLDYYGTLESDGVSVVEWGDRFEEASPASGLAVTLLIEGDSERRVEIVPIGARGEELAAAWVAAVSAGGGTST